MKEKKAPKKPHPARVIISKFTETKGINWAKETVLAKKLLEKFPEETFWKYLPVQRINNSLAVLFTDKAKSYLAYHYEQFKKIEKQKQFEIPQKIEYKLEETVTPEVIVEKPKHKSLKEFIKQYGAKSNNVVEEPEVISPESQIESFLKQNKGNHYNFEDDHSYKISTGSLSFDIAVNGGLSAGIIRCSGCSEGGKTSASLEFGRNFQNTVENSFVVYIKAEGRFSEDMKERSGLDFSPSKFFEFKTNIFETAISLIRDLIKNNPSNKRYLFIIDSMDALVPAGDIDRPFEEANKVSGGALLSSDFLRKMSLALTSRGHMCIMISQVRSKVTINPYEKADPKLTNASGGNAQTHYADWMFEFQPRFKADLIFDSAQKIIGHNCKIIIRKSANEKTGSVIEYPIKHGRKNGQSIWVELEIVNLLLQWELVQKGGAWFNLTEKLKTELTEQNLPFEDKYQGEANLRKWLEESPETTKYLYNKFKALASEV